MTTCSVAKTTTRPTGPPPTRRSRPGRTWPRVQQQFTFRSHDQVARFFAATDLIEPGLVLVEEWRPEPGTLAEGKPAMWGAVGRKR